MVFFFTVQSLHGQINKPDENELVTPLFGREKLEKIKEAKSLKKHLIALLNKYYRCLVTGPCTKKEMNEFRRDIKRTIYAIFITTGIILLLRRQYRVVQEAGEKPTWKFPAQYFQIRKKQAEAKVEKVKQQVEDVEEIMKAAKGVATGQTGVQVPYLGEVKVTPQEERKIPQGQPQPAPQPEEQQGWGEWMWSYVPALYPVPEE